ncbi:MAG TPA: HTH domain-containing protein [Myxococcales bacterium LLY-WYZ-16_1]|jgi:DNA-binding transcriptional regulator GbsR (MarR family)|nr:HTH domain-containing protein [Myxococcales bacterium LLY-WYZ-16_1]
MSTRRASAKRTTAPDPLSHRVAAVCDAVGAFIECWGFKAIHGRTWALLALSTQPLSQAEIAERLGVSRSLIHLTITELSSFGLVVPTGPERNAPYQATMDVWPVITDVLRRREWMLMEQARLALDAAYREAEYAEMCGEEPAYDRRRIGLLLAMTEFAQAVLSAVLGIRMPRSTEAFAEWLRRARRRFERLQSKIPTLSDLRA